MVRPSPWPEAACKRKTCPRYSPGSSYRDIEEKLGVPPSHRLDRYRASNDTEFEQKAAAIIGLYLDPPQNAAVFCVDEKSAIQALDRLDGRLPLSPGRAEKHGFEYHRHGTLSLYAALNPQTGEILGQTAPRHTSQEFVAFLEEVVATQPIERQVHVLLDNCSTHKTDLVKGFLQQHSNVKLHFTPTYSSWLNPVESWFSKLQRDVIDRGIFTSLADLKRRSCAIFASIRKQPNPFAGNLRCQQTDSGVVAIAQGQPTSLFFGWTRRRAT